MLAETGTHDRMHKIRQKTADVQIDSNHRHNSTESEKFLGETPVSSMTLSTQQKKIKKLHTQVNVSIRQKLNWFVL